MLSVFSMFCVGLSLMSLWKVVGMCLELVVLVLSENVVILSVMVIVDLEFELFDVQCGLSVLWYVL